MPGARSGILARCISTKRERRSSETKPSFGERRLPQIYNVEESGKQRDEERDLIHCLDREKQR